MLLNKLKVPFAWILGQMVIFKDHFPDHSIKDVTLDKSSQHLSVSDIILLVSLPVYCLDFPPGIQTLCLQGPAYPTT